MERFLVRPSPLWFFFLILLPLLFLPFTITCTSLEGFSRSTIVQPPSDMSSVTAQRFHDSFGAICFVSVLVSALCWCWDCRVSFSLVRASTVSIWNAIAYIYDPLLSLPTLQRWFHDQHAQQIQYPSAFLWSSFSGLDLITNPHKRSTATFKLSTKWFQRSMKKY